MASYYKGGKKLIIDGVPCKVASWVGELGNDREFLEATRPRSGQYKKAYYDGGLRVIVDGIPCRVSAHVKEWSRWMKAALLKGTRSTEKEAQEIEAQMEILFPAYVPRRVHGVACCTCCKGEYDARNNGKCWREHEAQPVQLAA